MNVLLYIEDEAAEIAQDAWAFLRPLLRGLEDTAIADLKALAKQAVNEIVADAGALISGEAFNDILPLVLSQATDLAQAAGKDLEALGMNLAGAVLAAMAEKMAERTGDGQEPDYAPAPADSNAGVPTGQVEG